MKTSIVVNDNKIDYFVKVSRRSKKIKLAVYSNGKIVVTVPVNLPKIVINNFILKHANWLLKKIILNNSKQKVEYKSYKESKNEALLFVKQRVEYFLPLLNFSVNKVTVRNQETRWGSCSKNKNLSFNYRLLFIPPDLADYVIVHEICHLKEMNHSKKFWQLVANIFPDYKQKKIRLKNLTL